MLSQNDVTLGFSQNTMPRGRSTSRSPRKRYRRSTSSRYAGGSVTRYSRPVVSGQGKTWPSQNKLTYRMAFDPFPAIHQATLRYSITINLDPTAGQVASHVFRSNSIFDPDYTATGHQPYGFDQYAALYNHYRVDDANIVMTPTSTGNGIFGISKVDDTTIASSMILAREQKGTVCAAMANTNTSNNTLMNFYTKSNMLNPHAVDSSTAGNPAENVFWQCWYSAANASTDESSRPFLVNIVYNVTFWKLKEFGLSS